LDVDNIEVHAESYLQAKVKEIKSDSLAEARRLLANQKAKLERIAEARDAVTAQVAHNKASLVSEAMSALGEQDRRLQEETSKVADLRIALDQATTWAQSEIKNVSRVMS
jgi:hypothetical protein